MHQWKVWNPQYPGSVYWVCADSFDEAISIGRKYDINVSAGQMIS